jgi:hypothetical protein
MTHPEEKSLWTLKADFYFHAQSGGMGMGRDCFIGKMSLLGVAKVLELDGR